MLQKLLIRNYAIIDNLALEPDEGLNTVTGETGAGKSIILGALSLILGERADTSVLINKEEKCVVEAHFHIGNNDGFRAMLRREELDEDPVCIIRREIAVSGKSRAFINDTPVTLAMLNRLTGQLVDLHQQFDTMGLRDAQFQLDVLDAVGQSFAQRHAYRDAYKQWRATLQDLQEARDTQQQWQKESDYKTFLLEELTAAAFKENEVEESASELKSVNHAERIQGVLAGARALLEDGEQPLTNELRRTSQQLSAIADLLPAASPLAARLDGAYAELKDIACELESAAGSVDYSPQRMAQLQERVDLGYRLFKKHGVQDTAGLLALQKELETALQATFTLSDRIEALEKETKARHSLLMSIGKELSAARKKAAPGIARDVNELLTLVGMPNARFSIDLKAAKEPAGLGLDEVAFMLDANNSGRFQPLYKAASGGEMSRIMLSIKSLTAKAMQLPTLIFDEVDTGISGEAARQVGVLLRSLGSYHQVICITHQPQVAARGARHFYVYKDAKGRKQMTTKVRILQPDERVLAIARMIGGEEPSEAALQNARELVTD